MKLLLASASPRRRELLAGLDLPMQTVRLQDVDETCPPTLRGGAIALHIARLKMSAYALPLAPDEVLVTADTVVWVTDDAALTGAAADVAPGAVFGKPKDAADARRMLRALSGRVHQVYTGVCLRSADGETSFVSRTDVHFARLTDAQIDYYIERYAPFDKAGAYGIQEWIGYVGVERLEGSYFNVMGLPVQRLHTELLRLMQP